MTSRGDTPGKRGSLPARFHALMGDHNMDRAVNQGAQGEEQDGQSADCPAGIAPHLTISNEDIGFSQVAPRSQVNSSWTPRACDVPCSMSKQTQADDGSRCTQHNGEQERDEKCNHTE